MGFRALPEESRTALATLAQDTSEEGRAAFSAALRDHHHAAGWSYRQLGKALELSHEYIRRLINAADSLESPVPVPAEPAYKPTTLQAYVLPAEIADDLKTRFAAALVPSLSDKEGPLSRPVAALYAGLAGAVSAGWDPYEVGMAIRMHPRAVGRFAAAYARHGGPAKIPVYEPAPKRVDIAWNARHPVELPVMIDPEDKARLAELRDAAGSSRGGDQSAAEYTRLLTLWYLKGASREELESATGQQWTTLRRRLLRWGVMRDPRKI